MRLLVTRPEPDVLRTAEHLRARGHVAIVAPLMRIEAIDADLGSGAWAAVLLTSANAARAVATHPRLPELIRLPILAVGRQSAEAARDCGFRDVTSAEGAAEDLVRLTAARAAGCPRRVLYLAGQDQSRDLAAELAPHGVEVRTVVVYRAVPLRQLPADVVVELRAGRIEGALHYSRRSASGLLEAAAAGGVREAVLDLAHYCLSFEVASVLREAGAGRMQVAPRPDEWSLIELIPAA